MNFVIHCQQYLGCMGTWCPTWRCSGNNGAWSISSTPSWQSKSHFVYYDFLSQKRFRPDLAMISILVDMETFRFLSTLKMWSLFLAEALATSDTEVFSCDSTSSTLKIVLLSSSLRAIQSLESEIEA